MLKLHLDTDIGSDMDDLCALAMLLRWPDVELTGITTSAEEGGRRAGYADYILRLAGRTDIPLTAGADAAKYGYRSMPGYPPDELYWPEPIARRPEPLVEALALLKRSIEAGALVVGTGPYTNLRLLDEAYPGILRQANVVLMGGYVKPPRPAFPLRENESDYNVQLDVASARYVFAHARPLLVPLTVTVETALRRVDLPRLWQAGGVARVVARQAEAYTDRAHLGPQHAGLPDDFINFLHDPLACAVALGWDGVTIEELPLAVELHDSWLVERVDPAGVPFRIVTRVDAQRFNRLWVDVVTGGV
jgi:inosine-uridine nucleoside N-ribohydrolase